MIKTIDIAWLGGLLEGEGCFMLARRRHPAISLAMTSEDTVIRASVLMKTKASQNKTMWRMQVNGIYAIQWMMTLYPFLGRRRKSTITEIIRYWKNNRYRAPSGMRFMATCHPDEVVHSFGLCNTCYENQRLGRKRLLKKVG